LTVASFWNQELEKDWYWLFQHLSTTCFSLAGLSFASVFGIFAFFKESGPPSIVISLLLIAGALFALAGEMAREAYFLWKFLAAESLYMVGLVLLGTSFLIFVNTQSAVLSNPIVVSAFLGIVVLFFCWRIVHNVQVARRHVKSMSVSQTTTSQERAPDKPNKAIYFEVIIFCALFGIAGALLNSTGPNMAMMTNTFATVSGVFLGLYIVIKPKDAERNTLVTQLLLFSILTSLISSMFSFSSADGNKALYITSALVFQASTVYFVIGTELLGPLGAKKKEVEKD
jgi:hypothetical protein